MHPFEPIAKVKSNALTELFHRYLEFLYQNYLQQGENKIWMREGDLDKPLGGPYLNQTLRCVLCEYRTVTQGLPNTFIFQGENGDGRRFFIRKILEVCYKSIHHIGWEQAKDEKVSFRFPVYIPKDMLQERVHGGSQLDLIELVCQCVIRQLELTDKYELKIARELVTELGHMGKLVVLFEEETCRDNQDFVERLNTLVGLEYQPIVVFIELPQFEINEMGNCYCIRMEMLTVPQIVKYLTAELPELYSYKETEKMLREQSEVVTLLHKPERMQIHVRVVRENPELRKATTINQIYDAFLSARINWAYKRQIGQKYSKKELESWLIKRAKGENSQDSCQDEQCWKFFADTELFQKHSTDFRFEGCKYYLIAKSYISPNLQAKDLRKRLLKILMNESFMVLKFFAGLYIALGKNQNALFKQLISLMDDAKVRKKYKEPAGLLAEVLTFTNRVGADGPEFVKWACREMRKNTYDTSVLEVLAELSQANTNEAITHQLLEQYLATYNAREKRRIVYCFGYMSQVDFPNQLIEDLCAPNPLPPTKESLHLQYHISAALVDRCWEIQDIRDYFPALEQALSRNSDPILRSDFDTLFARLNGQEYQYRDTQNQCENQLIDMLEHGPYWQKAHAAGAIGRRNYDHDTLGISSISTKLIQVLVNTISTIFCLGDEGHKEWKTVSYIVESCCQLAVKNNYRNKMKMELRRLLEFQLSALSCSGVSIVAYKHLQVALKLVGTGLKYLIDGKGDIRTELGLCFSSGENFLQALSRAFCGEQGADWIGLKEEIKRLESWSTPEGAEQELRGIFQEMSGCNGKLNFSLAYLWYGDTPQMAGFFFLFQNDIYFITCRHCFFRKGGNPKEPRLSAEALNQVSFFPACLNNQGRYHGVICYPENLYASAFFDGCADEDTVIYRLTDIPASFAQVVFSENDLPDGKILQEERLEAFSFPDKSRTQGKWFQCTCYKSGAHGFFTMHTDTIFNEEDANWFSGVPVIKSSDIITGMWKGSRGAKGEVWGITIQSILDKLDQIVEERGTINE